MSTYTQNPPHQVPDYPPTQVSGGGTGYIDPTPLSAPPVAVGQPVKDGYEPSGQNPPHGTQSRGDGFWRGCCAGMFCCCLLDICF
ncbi:putative cysteine-rich transmembrane CYSTM domain-containing protein [Helianthus annuus]|nr:putative cysteine-rich transmembrane CYSTM domain-containing protein [Helianthus annuus]